MSNTYKIAVLAGDGIGPEVMAVGLDVLHATAKKFGFSIDAREYAVGGAACKVAATRRPFSSAPSAGRNGRACPRTNSPNAPRFCR
jgi:isocitrate/isopropylmalate dehydrogenase